MIRLFSFGGCRLLIKAKRIGRRTLPEFSGRVNLPPGSRHYRSNRRRKTQERKRIASLRSAPPPHPTFDGRTTPEMQLRRRRRRHLGSVQCQVRITSPVPSVVRPQSKSDLWSAVRVTVESVQRDGDECRHGMILTDTHLHTSYSPSVLLFFVLKIVNYSCNYYIRRSAEIY